VPAQLLASDCRAATAFTIPAIAVDPISAYMAQAEVQMTAIIFTADLEPALCDFVGELERAYRSSPQSDLEKCDPIKFAQSQHVVGLLAVAKFLKRIKADLDLADKFASLSSAFFDLGTGTIHPVLRESLQSNRPVDPTEVWAIRHMVVNALNCLMLSGAYGSKAQAARYISDGFPALKKLCRRNSELETSILNWERSAKDGTIKNEIANDLPLVDFPRGLESSQYKGHAMRVLELADAQAQVMVI
jgi:hypothetical protein